MHLIAFVSQSENIMKSIFSTAMALEAVYNDLSAQIVDLGNEHRTIEDGITQRNEYGIQPVFEYLASNNADEILGVHDKNLCIIDMPSRATEATYRVVAKSNLIVQPVTARAKDFKLTIMLLLLIAAEGESHPRSCFLLVHIG